MMGKRDAFSLALFMALFAGCYEREGDFQIAMPQAAAREGNTESLAKSIRLEMLANDDGSLRTMRLDETPLGVDMTTPAERSVAFDRLRQELIQRLENGDDADNAELVFVADDDLDYEYIITAIATAPPADDGVSLVDKIKFETLP